MQERGIKKDCFAYQGPSDKKCGEECGILKTWYNRRTKELCKNCPFYKTHAQLRRETR